MIFIFKSFLSIYKQKILSKTQEALINNDQSVSVFINFGIVPMYT